MFNRIRVVTLLIMVLGVFALLQFVSGGLFFSSLRHSQESFVISNELREQQRELTSTRELMLQTRINLSRSAVRMMMDTSHQQSNAKMELLESAKKRWRRLLFIIKTSKILTRYLRWLPPVAILMKSTKIIMPH